MKYFFILLLSLISLQSMGSEIPVRTIDYKQSTEPDFEPQKLKASVILKWGGFAVASIGVVTVTVPVATLGGLCGLVGAIAQDVHIIRMANDFSPRADHNGVDNELREHSQNAMEFDLESVQVGSFGMYQLSKKKSCPFTVIEILKENSYDKVILIEYTEAKGKRKRKLTRASNYRLKFDL